ncbi:MAG: amidohydrolase, partial [Monoglobales bacterium]
MNDLEKKVMDAIDNNADKIIDFAKKSLENPELGYREHKTSKLVMDEFDLLNIPYQKELAVTGIKARLKGGKSDFNVAVIGELDAVKCYGHDYCDNSTGAAHACGHHAQLASMIGVAYGLRESGAMQSLGGDVSFMAVPAEEYIDLDFRRKLRDEGKIKFFGGKQQLICEGAFDDVDAAMMVHAQANTPQKATFVHGGSLGFLGKSVTFKGKAVHAAMPFDGVNALNAAALAILGIHANRETFREEEKIRIHPIITKGGDVVNSVPDEVCIDSYVRGATMPAIKKASACADRAIYGAAQMVGAEAEIVNEAGYLPLCQDYTLGEIYKEAAGEFLDKGSILEYVDMTGSTDMGDLTHIIPAIQPTVGGFYGDLHSRDMLVSDDYAAYVIPAKIMALTVMKLLSNDGKGIIQVKENFKPLM